MNQFTVHYLFEDPFTDEFMGRLVTDCLDFGCATWSDDRVHYTCELTSSDDRQDAPLDEALADLDASSHGTIHLRYYEFRVRLSKNLDHPIVPDIPHIGLTIDLGREYQLSENDERLQEKRQRLDSFIDLVAQVGTHTDPLYGYGAIDSDPQRDHSLRPDIGDIQRGIIRHLFWFNLLTDEMIAEFGRYRLLDAPAWRTDELDDGSILLVARPDPTDYGALDESLPELREYFGTEHPRL